MTYGFIAKSTNGALLASSDSANYELSQRISSGTRTGNVVVYYFTPVEFPVFFVETPIGGTAGILDFTNNSVRIICNGNYPVNVYKRVSSVSGFGIAAYDSKSKLTFKANTNILNVLSAGYMNIGGNFTGLGNSVAFPAVASTTTLVVSEANVPYSTYQTSQTVWVTFISGYDQWGSPIYSKTTTTVRTTWQVYALVRTHTWAVKRAVARRLHSTGYSQDWEVHSSGFYKKVLSWTSKPIGSDQPLEQIVLGSGYYPPIPPTTPDSIVNGFSGAFTQDNTFPYSNGQTISAIATILTS